MSISDKLQAFTVFKTVYAKHWTHPSADTEDPLAVLFEGAEVLKWLQTLNTIFSTSTKQLDQICLHCAKDGADRSQEIYSGGRN